mmetsp:Transcript_69820/g.158396  ORF Transcript_69820/g.158396 Transcript_69820/m.158396 type:complete len:378 (+) Transcript_69820:75-1208(+)|eukprot:CAMPEP_0197901372 /NCGR_PEP_ID=MMETSP1439-20131203/50966_1 /TAXON_ID=66791 /ORGANISM="Gonyaulax spinifera, Strain CCMP409" /LENGTH=377 /DNA_ID=CAMNT_0043522337 /DNA_START=73 /DNA_END=1206 /DNA_ORIENTATION=+
MGRLPARPSARALGSSGAFATSEAEDLQKAIEASRVTARGEELKDEELTQALEASGELVRQEAFEAEALITAVQLSVRGSAKGRAVEHGLQLAQQEALELALQGKASAQAELLAEEARSKMHTACPSMRSRGPVAEEEGRASSISSSSTSHRASTAIRPAESGDRFTNFEDELIAAKEASLALAAEETQRLKEQEDEELNRALAQSLETSRRGSAAAVPSVETRALDEVLQVSFETARHERAAARQEDEDALARALELSMRSTQEEWRRREAEAEGAKEALMPATPAVPVEHVLEEDAESEVSAAPEPDDDGLGDWWFGDELPGENSVTKVPVGARPDEAATVANDLAPQEGSPKGEGSGDDWFILEVPDEVGSSAH